VNRPLSPAAAIASSATSPHRRQVHHDAVDMRVFLSDFDDESAGATRHIEDASALRKSSVSASTLP